MQSQHLLSLPILEVSERALPKASERETGKKVPVVACLSQKNVGLVLHYRVSLLCRGKERRWRVGWLNSMMEDSDEAEALTEENAGDR